MSGSTGRRCATLAASRCATQVHFRKDILFIGKINPNRKKSYSSQLSASRAAGGHDGSLQRCTRRSAAAISPSIAMDSLEIA